MSPEIEFTPCCAISILRANNASTLRAIQDEIETHIIEGSGNGGCAPTIMCVTLPTEKQLAQNLRKVGFRLKYLTPRRREVGRGMLKVWFYTIPKERIIEAEKAWEKKYGERY